MKKYFLNEIFRRNIVQIGIAPKCSENLFRTKPSKKKFLGKANTRKK